MALTTAHPGVVRRRGRLYLVDPTTDLADLRRAGLRSLALNILGSAFIVATFIVPILSPLFVPAPVRATIAAVLPFLEPSLATFLLIEGVAVSALLVFAYLVRQKGPAPRAATDAAVPVASFNSLGIDPNDSTDWRALWALGMSLDGLDDAFSRLVLARRDERFADAAAPEPVELAERRLGEALDRTQSLAVAQRLRADLREYRELLAG